MVPVRASVPFTLRLVLLAGSSLLLAACGGGGGGGGGPAPIPPPPTAPPPPPPPPPPENFNTAEYRQSQAAIGSNAIAAWQAGASGKGVAIGFVDSGIATTNAEFAGRISTLGRDVSGLGRTIQDQSGHGTAVAGVAAAARDNAGQMGVAYDATILMMRADNGDCADGCRYTDASMAAGINAAIDANARVINISLAGSEANQALRDAFIRATQRGVVLVLSAGNDGSSEVDTLPLAALIAAGGDNLIIAGSSNEAGEISSFTNRAGEAQSNFLLAPGEKIRSFDHNGDAFLYSGTSFSAPAVSAAAALLAQAFPNLTGAQIVALLLNNAVDLGAAGTDDIYGRGRIDISRAMAPNGPTSLAGTEIAVALSANGQLGSAFGDGISGATALAKLPVTDSYGRLYHVALGQTIRTVSAGRLAGRLQSLGLEQAETESTGPFRAALTLRAAPIYERAGQDWFRDTDRSQVGLGFAQRGLDARAASHNPLRETRLSLRTGIAGFTAASGRLASETLPGAVTSGFVTDDGLQADEGTGMHGRQMLMVDVKLGAFTIAAASENRKNGLTPMPGQWESAEQGRVTMAVAWRQAGFTAAAHLSDMADDGAMLGTRLHPSFGLMGAHSTTMGLAAGFGAQGYAVRVAGSYARVTPDTNGVGLLRADGDLGATSWSFTGQAPMASGHVSLTVAQPLAISSGRFLLADGTPLAAGVTAAERAVELGFMRGGLSMAAFTRRNAGNVGGLVDNGAALSFKTSFQ